MTEDLTKVQYLVTIFEMGIEMKAKKILKKFLHYFMFKFFTIKNNKFVFTSYEGHYSDSPKYISEMIHEIDPNIEIVWLVNSEYRNLIPPYAKHEEIGSIRASFEIASASVRIDNVFGDKAVSLSKESIKDKLIYIIYSWLRKKKNLYTYTTWHGTPIKCIGKHQIGNSTIDFSCHNTFMILDNVYVMNIMKDVTFNKIPIKLLGAPRNDILFLVDENKKREIKNKLGLPLEKKIVLFAPTFRSDSDGLKDKNIYRSGISQIKEIDIEVLFDVLKRKFGGEWVFVCRFHYHVEKMIDWNELEKKYSKQIINGNLYDDMALYLACTDILITDASSSMFDFSLTYNPCFLYFPDFKYYKDRERGFYCDIEKLPFPIALAFEDLLNKIEEFDKEAYEDRIKKLHQEYGYINEKEATKKVAKYILDEHYKRK